MAISVKNAEAEHAVRKLAERTGVDLTHGIGSAQSSRLSGMRAIADRVAELPIKDRRPADEILEYDEAGLPS